MVNFILGHKIIVIIAALLLATLVWMGLSSGGSSSGSLLTTEVIAEGPDRDLVATLLELRAVKLDASLFSDPGFTTLKDFSTQIVPEPVGRPNPFAPLNYSGAVSSSSSKSAQIFSAPSGKAR